MYALGWTLWTEPMRAPLRRRGFDGLGGRAPRRVRHGRFNTGIAVFDRGGVSVPLTQTQLASAVADRAEISRNEAKRVLAALDEVVLEELGNAQKVRVGGLVQLTVRVKPAQKARKGRNPATGEEITIAAKPASVDLRARPLARAKAALPSVQKARRRLAA
jgi:DNA-binding protein HU-beta